jgi:hypothetical protein
MRLVGEVIWDLILATVAVVPVVVAPGIFPAAMALFGPAFAGLALHAIWRHYR